ncbi:polysaccharide deacetylase family protein [Halovenus sp. WSH3]|uniref:Polysaccharide deacetylase family protein n=1 Tax=Halovenus carboxidivorans TaxID=2692199 RepID=A0A6B0TEU8_9EURY|nr:polysaccharide deacetylase family protein [Halovenus carboxidivorans]MXR51719.1 polysaccharide deacetylase family protein [Halovenus carboxidivorans]
MTDRAVFSIDFELFEHTPAYRSAAGTCDGPVGLGAGEFLRTVLANNDATATCFVVGDVAKRHPEAVRALADAGHEIASHTQTHRLLTDLSAEQRRAELADSRETLESVTGETVSGFRAPAFDITDDHFELLAETGYEYDSSVVASRRIPGWYGGEYDLHRPSRATAVDSAAPTEITEVPTSVCPGVRLPLTGTWLRFFGPRYTVAGMKLLARRGIAPVLYVHPWELVDLPAVDGVPKRVYVRTGSWMRRAVEYILDQPFEFTTVRNVIAEHGLGDRA